MTQVISNEMLETWLNEHPAWTFKDDEIQYEAIFTDFCEAFAFISRVAVVMEAQNHHARIVNLYNSVLIGINTFSKDNQITDRDLKLAEAIEGLK